LAFIVGKGLLPEQQLPQLKGSPSAAVASLPKSMGGIAQVDIRAHASALQAKVAARLLWPHRQPWKVYMRHAFERCIPGLGVAVLVQQSRHAGTAALQPRHLLHLTAFRQIGLQRHVPHEQMSRQQIQLEPLVGNHSVCQPTTGQMLTSAVHLPQQLQQLHTMRLGAACEAAPQELPPSGLLLPAAWMATLQSPAPQDPWQVSTDGQWVRAQAAGGAQYYRVLSSAQLQQLPLQEVPVAITAAGVIWHSCCVVDTAAVMHSEAIKRQQQQQQGRQETRQETPEDCPPPHYCLFL